MASSRAGSLPQRIGVWHLICGHRRSSVGVSLLAMAACQTPKFQIKNKKPGQLSRSGLPGSKDRSLRRLLQ
ncbi:hypothetical protein EVS84_17495 [Pseudomonas koreensis]|uniref:Uncharacterized protein n=1 Tax=Pseudomonas koreensis TaxID=198620 RepID=A0A4Q4L176_9PSED|nr:hypothetical protein EVS84_17495 [Pseudomonas koreensis]